MSKKRVAIVGSGNWGCAIAKIVGNNAARHNHLHEEVGRVCAAGFWALPLY